MIEEIEELWTTSDEEKTLEPEIEEFLACFSADPLCITECEDQFSEEPHDLSTRESQGNKDYIESWFQTVIRPQYSSILQHFLASSPQEQLVSHVRTTIEVYFSYLDMSILINMLCTWLHWKYSYT
jgi:hypothetical protein